MPRTMCPHGHDTSVEGRTRQGRCRECERERHRAYRARNQARARAYRRARYERLKAAGLCVWCAADVALNALCFSCLGRKDEANMMRIGG